MFQRITVSILLAASLLFTPYGKLFAHVDKTFFLKGKIGERSIAIKMLNYDETNKRDLYYYFSDDKRDHFLVGTYQNKGWLFTSKTIDNNTLTKPAIILTIADNTNGIWKAIWQDSLGNKWDIILTTLTTNDISNNFSHLSYVTELDPYERYRLANVQFTNTTSSKLSKQLTCNWLIDAASGITFFRLKNNNKHVKTDSINAMLETMHLNYLQQYYAYNADKTNLQIATTILYHNSQLISFKTLATTTLKHLATQTNRQLFTLNIANGLQVNLEDIIWLDSAENKPDLSNLFSVYKYRKNVFAPKMYALLQQLYPTQMQSSQCHINQVVSWALPDWCLTNKGLALGFRNEEGCDVLSWAIIPYSMLAPYIESKYQLAIK